MQLRGEQQIPVPPERFWELVFDPDHLTNGIPGATSIKQESAHRFTGTINRSLSGITVDMDVDVEVTEDTRPQKINCRFHGDDSGTDSALSGTITIVVSSVETDTTEVTYAIDWQLLGRLGSIGSRMVKRQLQHDLTVFFNSFTDTQDVNATPSTT